MRTRGRLWPPRFRLQANGRIPGKRARGAGLALPRGAVGVVVAFRTGGLCLPADVTALRPCPVGPVLCGDDFSVTSERCPQTVSGRPERVCGESPHDQGRVCCAA